jgi:hypothetical protein
MFLISGTGANVILTKREEAGNDTTLVVTCNNDTCEGLTLATSTNTLAGVMTLTNCYCTIAELKSRVLPSQTMADGNTITTTEIDTILAQIIEAVSRWIDEKCGRFFYYSSDQVIYYTPKFRDLLYTEDIISISKIESDDNGDGTYENTWATSDYVLEPVNNSIFGRPYNSIILSDNSNYEFIPSITNHIKLTATIGWNAVPKQIKEACILQSERLYMKRDAPLGVMGESRFGAVRIENSLDVDIKEMLAPYTRVV